MKKLHVFHEALGFKADSPEIVKLHVGWACLLVLLDGMVCFSI